MSDAVSTKGKEFKLVLNEIQESKGDQFNKSEFFRLFAAFLQDKDYSVDVVKKIKDGSPEIISTLPVKEFEKFLVKVIKKTTGLKPDEAEAAIKKYNFDKADAESIINVSTEIIEQWIRAGKIFKFPTKEDMKLSLEGKKQDKKVLEGVIKGKEGTPDRAYKTEHGQYIKIVSKSPCPTNKKKNLSKKK